MKVIISICLFCKALSLSAQTAYEYTKDTRASEYAKHFFGYESAYERSKRLNMGKYSAAIGTKLDCGSLDLNANFDAEFKRLQQQLKQIIPNSAAEWKSFGGKMAMLSICYAYPTICAQLRHDFLALQGNLDLRAQACKAMDGYIDSQADVGAKQLRAEAQANCVDGLLKKGTDLSSATAECQGKKGLPMRDFTAGFEKKFIHGKQKVLQSMLQFAKAKEPATYDFLSAMLGEVEVQEDGYWQPVFDKGMLRPHEVALNFLAEGEIRICGDLEKILDGTFTTNPDDLIQKNIVAITKTRLTQEDLSNLEDLSDADRKLACAGLGRAIGQLAANKAAAHSLAVMSTGILNAAIPTNLRTEYGERSEKAVSALIKAVEGDQIPPLDTVRGAVANLAKATREKTRIIAALASRAKGENVSTDNEQKYDCTDTLSCRGRL